MRYVCGLLLILLAAGFFENACASSMILNWNASLSSHIAGYNVYYGTTAGNYPYKVNAGNSTTITISSLTPGAVYYFVATAYDVFGNESAFSTAVRVVVPSLTTTTTQSSGGSQTSLLLKGEIPGNSSTLSVVTAPPSGATVVAAPTSSVGLAIMRRANSHSPALIQFPVTTGHTYEVQASTNFRDWISVWQTNVAAASSPSIQFSDTNAGSFSSRFYRVVLQ